MVLVTAQILLSTDECHSLKEKRQIILRIKDSLKHKFNVSVAEIDFQNSHNRVLLGVVLISNEVKFANSVMSKVINFVETAYPGRLLDYTMDVESR